MPSLLGSFKRISDPNGWYLEENAVTGTIDNTVPTQFNRWTIAIIGPSATYTVSVKGASMADFRLVEDGIIDGTVAGFVVNFEGSVEAIRIVPGDGSAFEYSLSGKLHT